MLFASSITQANALSKPPPHYRPVLARPELAQAVAVDAVTVALEEIVSGRCLGRGRKRTRILRELAVAREKALETGAGTEASRGDQG